jgi:HSP20 family protein
MRALVTPERGLANLRREMDQMFRRLWEPDVFDMERIGDWVPQLDVSETTDAVRVRVEIPGIDPKEIQVTLEGQLLTVKGEKKQEHEEKGERFYRTERTYGSFVRTIRLPAPVEGKKVEATFKNGVLTVLMPKALAGNGNVIPVKVE